MVCLMMRDNGYTGHEFNTFKTHFAGTIEPENFKLWPKETVLAHHEEALIQVWFHWTSQISKEM